MRALRLVFMGTPRFALPSLKLLNNSIHRIAALVVPPDRPSGRGGKVNYAPTKDWALQLNLKIFQPIYIGDSSFLSALKKEKPDLIVTAAYGRLLPPVILELPSIGSINLHASYLPAFRGAAPIHRAVIEGAEYSGVSVIEMTSELDAGDIILQEREKILFTDTAGTLHDRLAERGANLLLKAVNQLAEGSAVRKVQDPLLATYAPPLSADDEKLNWNLTAKELYNHIRGLNPWPGAYTTFRGKRVKVWKAVLPDSDLADQLKNPAEPGTILEAGKGAISIMTGKGSLVILELQPAGKNILPAEAFCCGYRLKLGERLGEV